MGVGRVLKNGQLSYIPIAFRAQLQSSLLLVPWHRFDGDVG
jgi:hypothetical protein